VTLRAVIKKLIEVAQKKPVVLCIGNHEIEGHLSTTYAPIYSDVHGNIHVLSSENPHVVIEAGGRKIGFHGFEFMRSRERAEEMLSRISGDDLKGEVNILCLHQAVERYLEPHDVSIRSLRDVAQKYNLILLGHVHKRQKIAELEDITPAYYVGSTERISFNEAENPTGIAIFGDDFRNPSFVGVESAAMKNLKLKVESANPEEVNSKIRSVVDANRDCKLLRVEVDCKASPSEISRDFPEYSGQFTILDIALSSQAGESDLQMEKTSLSEGMIREYFQKTGSKDKDLEETCVRLFQKYGG